VGTQAYTDPRLGQLAIQLLDLGYPAPRVLAELEASDPHLEWRQLGIIDRWGHTAVRIGGRNTAWAGHRTGDAWIVMGNALVGEGVVQAMASARQPCSCTKTKAMPSCICASMTHPEPTQELWRLFNKMYPLKPYYKERPDNPAIGRVSDWGKARGIAL